MKIFRLDTRRKQVIGLVLACLLLLGAAYGLLRFGFGFDALNRSGWKTKANGVQYLNYFGRPRTQWQYVDGKLYYFDRDTGYMATGWRQIGSARYYFDATGSRVSGWQTIENKDFYFGENGKLVTGWSAIDGKTYYFTKDGSMATGWQTIEDKRYCFSEEGMAMIGWQMLDGKLYYFTATGNTLSGWTEMDGVRFYFAQDGSVQTGWFEDETGKYFFDEDGHPHRGWLTWEQERYYCNDDGTLLTGWLQEGMDRYYLLDDGTMAVGQTQVDGIDRFFDSSGKELLLCNAQYAVPEDYVVSMASIEGFQFNSTGRDFLQQMLDACRAAELDCEINNTYRSKATQQQMWDKSVKEYMAEGMSAEEAAAKTGKDTALPGHSEHQTGLAVDLTGSAEMYAWLAEHCWEYGFILRYPEACTEHTGIIYEPWHFRYVGTDLALELKESGMCLEEYVMSLTNPENPPKPEEQPEQENQTAE